MAEKSWLKKISALKRLISEVGPLWPKSTRLSGYAESGPYHCEDCVYLKGKKEGEIFVDKEGQGRCMHPVVIADRETKKDKNFLPIVNIQKGCCEFVEPPEDEEESE
ncbi:MAG TPA: hypothetical protein VFA52_03975 [Candidatus Paceibacterota bacterium]|jgi:hypothetical protein|nr:hypothetical protein [Candidatus Paceibacterota bacterium]